MPRRAAGHVGTLTGSHPSHSFTMEGMRRAPLVLAFLAFLTALLAAGCQQAQMLGGKDRPKRYAKIVSLSPSTTEILAGNGVRLAGRTAACDYPAQSVGAVPVVAAVKPDYEALSRIRPDLIVYDAELYGDAEIRKLAGTGATMFRFDPKSLDEYERAVYEMGSLTATETGLSSYVDRVNAEAENAQADPPTPKPKVAVILPDASGRHLLAGTQGLRAECVRLAGGDMVGPASNRFEPLSPEFLVKEDPDVIILAGKREDFERDARFARLKARRNANVYGLPQDLILRRGARVDKLIDNLHKALALSTKPAAARGQG